METFASFVAFMEADNGRRARFLKRLDIYCGDGMSFGTHSQNLARILACCTHLERLHLSDGYVLDVDVRIGAALARLKHLERLRIGTTSGVVNLSQVLACMLSACTCVSLDYQLRFDYVGGEIDSAANDPNVTLSSLAPSLQVLALVAPTFSLSAVQYVHLTTLNLAKWDIDVIQPILLAFPNLRRLLLSECIYPPDEEVEDLRSDNQLAFQRHGWPHLDYFNGELEELYLLGIDCHIRRWDIFREYDTINCNEHIKHLPTLLAANHPTHLHIEISLGEGRGVLANFLTMLLDAVDSGPGLTHLAIEFVTVGDSPADWAAVFVSVDPLFHTARFAHRLSLWQGLLQLYALRVGLQYLGLEFAYGFSNEGYEGTAWTGIPGESEEVCTASKLGRPLDLPWQRLTRKLCR